MGYGFLFRSEFFFRTTQELEYLFFLSRKAQFFFQKSTLGYMIKTLNQIIFFSSTKIRIFFFSNIGNQNILLEKNHNPPFKLNGPSLNFFYVLKCSLLYIYLYEYNFVYDYDYEYAYNSFRKSLLVF